MPSKESSMTSVPEKGPPPPGDVSVKVRLWIIGAAYDWELHMLVITTAIALAAISFFKDDIIENSPAAGVPRPVIVTSAP